MYLFKIVEKILAQEEKEQKTINVEHEQPSYKRKDFHRKETQEKNQKYHNKSFSQNTSQNTSNNSSTAYCLFANSGESFLAKFNNDKATIYLNGIDNPDKFSNISKQANKVINELIKGKVVYLNLISNEENKIVADIFLDKEKKHSLNSILIEKGLGFSSEKQHEVSDMKIVENLGYQLPDTKSAVHLDNIKADHNPSSSVSSSVNTNNKVDFIIGYLKKCGRSPYLHKNGNNMSYYITLEKDNQLTTKWGIDLERALSVGNVEVGDYIRIHKTQNTTSTSSSKASWTIEKIDDLDTHHSKIDGPPLSDIPVEDSIQETQLYGYQEPPDWDNMPDNYYDNNAPILEDVENITVPTIDEKLSLQDEAKIENPHTSQTSVNTSSIDLMDDILAALDEPLPKKTPKIN